MPGKFPVFFSHNFRHIFSIKDRSRFHPTSRSSGKMKRILFYVPLLLAAAIFFAGLLVAGHRSYETNDNHWVYTLDDSYIHMAIAKNLALHGVFGLTQYGFSSSSSSPLWTLLVAMTYKLTGVCDWPPAALATMFALASLYATHSLSYLFGLKAVSRFIICCAVIYFTPLIPLVSTGMEHTMHLFFIIVLMASVFRFMESPDRRKLIVLCLAGCLATASRYESLFYRADCRFPIARQTLARRVSICRRIVVACDRLRGVFCPSWQLFSAELIDNQGRFPAYK